MSDNAARPEQYGIHVKGQLEPHRSEWFDGLIIAPLEGSETILSGPVADQAALYGLLAKIRDFFLMLIAATRVTPQHPHGGKDENSE